MGSSEVYLVKTPLHQFCWGLYQLQPLQTIKLPSVKAHSLELEYMIIMEVVSQHYQRKNYLNNAVTTEMFYAEIENINNMMPGLYLSSW